MGLTELFQEQPHQTERAQLPLLRELVNRYGQERPFDGTKVVFPHVLVRNSMVIAEALYSGGATLVFADAFPSPADAEVRSDLIRHGVHIWPLEQAVRQGDYYLDVSAVLGRTRPPKGAAEATRTGVILYEGLGCPVVSADNSRCKLIEGFFGTGDAFLRAWKLLRPSERLLGKKVVQFGYGKIGRGVAWRGREAGLDITVAELDQNAANRARSDGFPVVHSGRTPDLKSSLEQAEIVIAVTGIPDVISETLPPEWLRANSPVLVNLGAMDEFGPSFEDGEILGGRAIPLNFHLPVPTWNRYVDPALSAHVMALEALLTRAGDYGPGVHPLPPEMDQWIIESWHQYWPDEDLRGIAQDLGLPT